MSLSTVSALDRDAASLAMHHDPRLYNDDLAPTTAARRTWGTYNYIALWFSMSMEVTTYMLASSLIAGGMNWKQAIFTILLGNLIVLVPMLLNAHAGAKYGIPFPVFVRASFGYAWGKYSGDAACDCCVWVVWDSVVDGGAGDCCDDGCSVAGRRRICLRFCGRVSSGSGC